MRNDQPFAPCTESRQDTRTYRFAHSGLSHCQRLSRAAPLLRLRLMAVLGATLPPDPFLLAVIFAMVACSRALILRVLSALMT